MPSNTALGMRITCIGMARKIKCPVCPEYFESMLTRSHERPTCKSTKVRGGPFDIWGGGGGGEENMEIYKMFPILLKINCFPPCWK